MASYSDGRLDRMELMMRRMEAGFRRLGDLVAEVDQRSRTQAAGLGFGRGGGGGGSHVRAIAAGTIAQGTFFTLGSGPAQRYRLEAGEWVEDGEPVTAYVQYGGGDIEEGTALILVPIAGLWFVDTAGCEVDPDYVPPEA